MRNLPPPKLLKIAAVVILATAMSVPASLAQEKDKKGFYVAGEVGQASIKSYCSDLKQAAAAVSAAAATATNVPGVTASVNKCTEKQIVFGADVGYQFNKYFAAELGGRISSGYETETSLGVIVATAAIPLGTIKTKSDLTSALLGVRGSYPFNDKFSVHINTGFHAWKLETKATGAAATLPANFAQRATVQRDLNAVATAATQTIKEDGTDPYYGIGADYSFTDKLSARVNFTRVKLSGSDGEANRDADYISGAVVYRF